MEAPAQFEQVKTRRDAEDEAWSKESGRLQQMVDTLEAQVNDKQPELQDQLNAHLANQAHALQKLLDGQPASGMSSRDVIPGCQESKKRARSVVPSR